MAKAKSDYEAAKRIKKNPSLPTYTAAYQATLAFRAFTVVHELVHCFVTFLGGAPWKETPVGLAPLPYRDAQRGEAGRTWEVWALGGWVELYYSWGAATGEVGEIWLTKADGRTARVDPDAIGRLVNRSKLLEANKTCLLLPWTDGFEQTSGSPWTLLGLGSIWVSWGKWKDSAAWIPLVLPRRARNPSKEEQ